MILGLRKVTRAKRERLIPNPKARNPPCSRAVVRSDPGSVLICSVGGASVLASRARQEPRATKLGHYSDPRGLALTPVVSNRKGKGMSGRNYYSLARRLKAEVNARFGEQNGRSAQKQIWGRKILGDEPRITRIPRITQIKKSPSIVVHLRFSIFLPQMDDDGRRCSGFHPCLHLASFPGCD